MLLRRWPKRSSWLELCRQPLERIRRSLAYTIGCKRHVFLSPLPPPLLRSEDKRVCRPSESHGPWEHNGDVFLQRRRRVNVVCGLRQAAELFFLASLYVQGSVYRTIH
jgi:hypothetical protein